MKDFNYILENSTSVTELENMRKVIEELEIWLNQCPDKVSLEKRLCYMRKKLSDRVSNILFDRLITLNEIEVRADFEKLQTK